MSSYYPRCALFSTIGETCFAFLNGRCRCLLRTYEYEQQNKCPFYKHWKKAVLESQELDKKTQGTLYDEKFKKHRMY